jgi:hypothetical protein
MWSKVARRVLRIITQVIVELNSTIFNFAVSLPDLSSAFCIAARVVVKLNDDIIRLVEYY